MLYEIIAISTLLLVLGTITGLAFALSGSVLVAGSAGFIALGVYLVALFNFRG